MKINLRLIKWGTLFAIFVIGLNQAMWIYNMYRSYNHELSLILNDELGKAILAEIVNRTQQVDGPILIFGEVPIDSVANNPLSKTVTLANQEFMINSDRLEPNLDYKVMQLVLRDEIPLNINVIDSLLRKKMFSSKYSIENLYVEYFDLAADTLIDSNRENRNFLFCIKSDTNKIDINNTLGIQACIDFPFPVILNKMIYQLMLSLALIILSIYSFWYLLKVIFAQKKEEKMRQNTINAMMHEYKRPISGAVMNTSLIPYYIEKGDDERAKAYAETTLLELTKLTAYTERIQRISNNEKGEIVLNKDEIKLHPFFESLQTKYQEKGISHNKTVHINMNIASERESFQADLLHFSNVMDNLIENAIKYSKTTVDICVRIVDENNKLRISVSDNGIGLSKIDKIYIFERFYRSRNKEVQNSAGFGLGLTYVKAIVEAHLGRIEVKSELGVGSEFTIHLPVC